MKDAQQKDKTDPHQSCTVKKFQNNTALGISRISYKLPERKMEFSTKDHENTFSNRQDVKKFVPGILFQKATEKQTQGNKQFIRERKTGYSKEKNQQNE